MLAEMITAQQIKAARALLEWEQTDLVEKTGLSLGTVSNVERGSDPRASTLTKIQRALESAGIEFTNGEAPGVRLKSKKRKR